MREILFRAWDRNTNKMLYVSDNQWTETIGKMLDSFEDEDLMQWTGLKDKKGKEIYEGDIIKISYGTVNFENKKEIVTDVYFEKAAFRYRHKDGSGSVLDFNSVKIVRGYECITQDVEIIGNRFQNPELIKE